MIDHQAVHSMNAQLFLRDAKINQGLGNADHYGFVLNCLISEFWEFGAQAVAFEVNVNECPNLHEAFMRGPTLSRTNC